MNYRDWLLALAIASVGLNCFAATTYTYDSLNRLTGVDYGNGSTISYTYDAAGNRLTSNTVVVGGSYLLTATKTGTGGGTVAGSGIDCGTDCSESYVDGTSVTLTATPQSGATFSGWGGDCASFGVQGTCTLTMNAAKNVTAGFAAPLPTFALAVTASGTGAGTVAGTGIDCGSDCSESYVSGSIVTLTATPAADASFAGWGGACNGAGTCTVTMDAAKSITATFTLKSYAITATASPVAGGSVSCMPNPVSHGGTSTCTASASAGYTFSAFSGDCSGSGCTLSNVTAAKSVTATFALKSYAITATASPVAGGSVNCTPNPVSHGGTSTCVAGANAGYTFSAFSGDCSGSGCTLSNVTAAKSVTATFTLKSYAITATASPQAGGNVSCTPNPVSHGGTSTCTASANAGYTFSAFSGDCSGSTCALSNVTAAKSVTATFTLKSYAITATASPVAGGSVSCTPNPVSHGGTSTCVASANAGYTFSAFSGDCSGSTCALSNVTSPKGVTATFSTSNYVLTVTKTGTGSGAVTGGGIDCGNDCGEGYASGTSVTLTATPQSGATFSGWGGDCAAFGMQSTCTLTMNAAKNVTAGFAPPLPTFALSVTKTGTGSGTVTGTGIDCGSDCNENYMSGGSVTLAANSAADSTFAGWSGACTGAGTCTVTMDAAKNVTATFALKSYAITATASPVAGGSVNCTPNPVSHGGTSTCVTSANAGYTFSAFSGDCSGSGCTLSNVTVAKNVTATFTTATYVLTVAKSGPGSGKVTGSGIDCGSDCTEGYGNGSLVTLTATPAAGSTFAGWSGACANSSGICAVTMTAAQNVVATFNAGEGDLLESDFGGFSTPEPGWFTLSDGARGTVAASPPLAAGQVSRLERSFTGPGYLDFAWRVSSAANVDFLSLHLDGNEIAYRSGAKDWLLVAVPIPLGPHTVGWEYEQTSAAAPGTSGGRIDAVTFTPSAVSEHATLRVQVSGSAGAAGRVASSPSLLNCGANSPDRCEAELPFGPHVLFAVPASGSTFVGWTGCDGVYGSVCKVMLGGTRTVVALFSAGRSYDDVVQEAYVAYYGRPADLGGQQYWANRLRDEGGNLTNIMQAFGNSEEANRLFGNLSNEGTVTTLYRQILGRDPECQSYDTSCGWGWWVNELASGRRTRQTIALALLNGAQNEDRDTVDNRVRASNALTGQWSVLNQTSSLTPLQVEALWRQYLSYVSSVASSMEEAIFDAPGWAWKSVGD